MVSPRFRRPVHCGRTLSPRWLLRPTCQRAHWCRSSAVRAPARRTVWARKTSTNARPAVHAQVHGLGQQQCARTGVTAGGPDRQPSMSYCAGASPERGSRTASPLPAAPDHVAKASSERTRHRCQAGGGDCGSGSIRGINASPSPHDDGVSAELPTARAMVIARPRRRDHVADRTECLTPDDDTVRAPALRRTLLRAVPGGRHRE